MQSRIETAITEILDSIGTGNAIIEYEINGRRIVRSSPSQLLETLRKMLAEISPLAAQQSRGSIFSLGSFRGN